METKKRAETSLVALVAMCEDGDDVKEEEESEEEKRMVETLESEGKELVE